MDARLASFRTVRGPKISLERRRRDRVPTGGGARHLSDECNYDYTPVLERGHDGVRNERLLGRVTRILGGLSGDIIP